MRIRFSKTSVFRMALKRFKLQQFFDGVTRNVSTHKHVKLHHFCKFFFQWCSITPSGNTLRQHQCGKQARALGPDCARCTVFCQTFTNPAKLQIILPKYCRNSAKSFHDLL